MQDLRQTQQQTGVLFKDKVQQVIQEQDGRLPSQDIKLSLWDGRQHIRLLSTQIVLRTQFTLFLRQQDTVLFY